jgi:hypothetical protein
MLTEQEAAWVLWPIWSKVQCMKLKHSQPFTDSAILVHEFPITSTSFINSALKVIIYINSAKQIPSKEVNIFSTNERMSRLSWNWTVYYRVQISHTVDLILTQMDQVHAHTHTHQFLKLHFKRIHPFIYTSSLYQL